MTITGDLKHSNLISCYCQTELHQLTFVGDATKKARDKTSGHKNITDLRTCDKTFKA